MKITVNGELQEFAEKEISVLRLLDLNSVEDPEMVSVQRNGEIIDQEQYDSTVLTENDTIEFLYFMGGGYSS